MPYLQPSSMNFREPPSSGAHIKKAWVVQKNSPRRTLVLSFNPEKDGIDFADIKRMKDGQRDKTWTTEQLMREREGENYFVAAEGYPLRGFGVGLLPVWKGKVLVVGKQEERGVKITASSGYTTAYRELSHPVLGAAREFATEVGFVKDSALYLPAHTGTCRVDAKIPDESVDIHAQQEIKHKLKVYNDACIADKTVEGKLDVQFTTNNLLSERLGLDRIVFQHAATKFERAFNGLFYWDPNTAGVNILFYANITTDGTPFSAETLYNEPAMDEAMRVVALAPEQLYSLDQPRTLEAKVYTSHDARTETLQTIPGGMNKAIARILALRAKK